MKVFSSYLDSHFRESFTIDEVGMKLIPETHSRIRAKLQSLEARAPAVSAIQLKFINEGHVIKGELSVMGAGKFFFSEKMGQEPWSIYLSLEKDIDGQLIQWKKTRFLDKYISPLIPEEQEKLTGGYAL